MDAYAVTRMCQIMGALCGWQAGGFFARIARELFWPDGELCFAEGGTSVGTDKIEGALGGAWNPYFAPGSLHLLHSAAYRTDGGDVARGHWNTYSYCVSGGAVRMSYLRLTGDFCRRDGEWRLGRLHVLHLMTLSPWRVAGADMPALPPVEPSPVTPEDFLALRNLAGRFAQDGPEGAGALMSDTAEPELDLPQLWDKPVCGADAVKSALMDWADRERGNGMYLTHITVQSPVVTMLGLRHARVSAFGLAHNIRGRDRGITEEPYGLTRQIVRLEFMMTREAAWRIARVALTPLVTLAEEAYRFAPGHRQLMTEPDKRIVTRRSPALRPEDAFEIESIMPQWTEGVKRPDLYRFAEGCMDVEAVDPSMHFSFDYIGREAVRKRCRELICRFADKNPELWRYPQFHTANTPVIEVDPTGMKAAASWFDYGWGNIGVAVFYEPGVAARQYFPGMGEYYHGFIKEGGRWKLYRFFWRPLMGSLPAWDFDTRTVGGWSARGAGTLWPLPFEEFHYEED